MALTPEKRAALAVKGYTPEELSALDAKTDEFRQRLAAMGISMKDVEEPAPTPPAPPAPAPAPTPTPEAVPAVNTAPAAPVAASAPAPFTLDDLRSVIREEVGAATKELSTKVATIEAEAKQTDDERFAAMWKERAANPGAPASRSTETVVQGGSKEAVAAGQGNAWVGNIPLFQWLGTDGMQGQGVGGQN